MVRKILIAGVLGGLMLFVWESVAHMVLPLGTAGIKALANEPAVLAALKENVKEAGFYFFPAPEDRPGMTAAQKQEAMARAEQMMLSGPVGLMQVHPEGDEGMTASRLLVQCLADIVAMFVAALVLAQMKSLQGFAARLGIVVVLALFPPLRTEIPMWNWYGFPTAYTAAQLALHLIGFLLGGLILVKLIKGTPQ
jgi:hypothetical protein